MAQVTSYNFDHTDERNAARLHALIEHNMLQVCEEVSVNTGGTWVNLQCKRKNCDRTFSASVNKKDGYSSVIAHVTLHPWKAGVVLDLGIEQLHQQKVAELVSSPRKRCKHWAQDEEGKLISPPSGKSSKPVVRTSSTGVVIERSDSKVVSTRAEYAASLVVTIASLRLPIRIVEDAQWRHTQAQGGCPYVFNKKEIGDAMHEQANAVRAFLATELTRPRRYVSLAVDSVTNVRQDKVYTFVIVCKGRAHYWCSENIGTAPDTGDAAAALISKVINELRGKNIRVASLVTDSASNMVAGRKKVAIACNVLPVSCGAHLIHNCAMKIIDSKHVVSFIDAFNHIISRWGADKATRESFRRGKTRRLVRHNDTRWSSHFYAYKRLVDDRDKIVAADPSFATYPTSEQWAQLAELLDVLVVFDTHNKVVQSDKSTMVDAYDAIVAITDLMHKAHSSSKLINPSIWVEVWHYWNKRITEADCKQLWLVAAFLARIENRHFPWNIRDIYKWFNDNSINVLKSIGFPCTPDTVNRVISQLKEFEISSDHWELMPLEDFQGRIVDYRHYWLRRMSIDGCQELAHIAYTVVTITPSEASVERSFSSLKLQWTARRNCLATERINDLMMIKSNHSVCVEKRVLQHEEEDNQTAEDALAYGAQQSREEKDDDE